MRRIHLLATLACAWVLGPHSIVWANWDLAHLSTNTVKQNQPWASIETKINALDIRLEVNRGLVTTHVTLEYTPGAGQMRQQICDPGCIETRKCLTKCITEYKEVEMDSLETSGGFQLGDNGAITDMYLWVGDVKVKAAIQDRGLASAQYESIVKRRKDPALVETWGNGRYTLRIFPNQSNASRKIEIEFIQAMENNQDGFNTILPVIHSLVKVAAYYNSDAAPDSEITPLNRFIGLVNLSAQSLDGNTYDLDWPGLGKGRVGANPLKLHAIKVEELKQGRLSEGSLCLDCLKPWIGKASAGIMSSSRTPLSFFGVKSTLIYKNLELQPEPKERVVLLDVDGKHDATNIDRARKLALLTLKAYAQAPYIGNLAYLDAHGTFTLVFGQAVEMNAVHLAKVYEAVKTWKPARSSDYNATLRAYLQSRTSKQPSVALLLNDQQAEYFSEPYPSSRDADKISEWSKRRADFETAQNAKSILVSDALSAAEVVLCGFWQNYRINSMAEKTGGVQLGSLWGWNSPYRYDLPAMTTDGLKSPEPYSRQWVLPALFGLKRPYSNTLQDLKVSVSPEVNGLAVLNGRSQSYGWYDMVPMNRAGGIEPALAKSALSIAPNYYGFSDSIPVRISGNYTRAGQITIDIQGKLGGLGFTKIHKVDLPSPASSAGSLLGGGLWAYQKSEEIGRSYPGQDSVKTIQTLGRNYHIVNRQTSLLALEPGMDLWDSLPTNPSNAEQDIARTGAEFSSAPTTADGKASLNGTGSENVDSFTLEDILAGTVSSTAPTFKKSTLLPNVVIGESVRLNLPGAGLSTSARFTILDIKGRALARLTPSKNEEGFTAQWHPGNQRGTFVFIAEADGLRYQRKFVLRH